MDLNMDARLAERIAWLLRQSPKRLNFIARARWAGLPEDLVGALAWATYRRRTGLEARAAIALAMAPEVIPEARRSFSVRLVLNPALAALVTLLLDLETPAAVLERMRIELAGRTYLPDGTDRTAWRQEAVDCLAELHARRARWDTRASEQLAERQARSQRRRSRASTSGPN
jgi:hypothetical protein